MGRRDHLDYLEGLPRKMRNLFHSCCNECIEKSVFMLGCSSYLQNHNLLPKKKQKNTLLRVSLVQNGCKYGLVVSYSFFFFAEIK